MSFWLNLGNAIRKIARLPLKIPETFGALQRWAPPEINKLLNWRQRVLQKQITIATSSEESFKQGLPKDRNELNFIRAYERNLWVHVAVRAIAESAAMLPIHAFREETRRDGQVQKVRVNEGLAVDLLDMPSKFETPYEWKLAMFGSFGYHGNAFNYVDPDIPSMVALRPQDVEILASKANFIEGYLFERSQSLGKQFFIPPERIVHIKSFHPDNYFYGLSPLSAAWDQVSQLDRDDQYWNTFYREGGRVMGMWSTTQSLSDAQYERMKLEIRGQYKGTRNMYRDFILSGGLKFDQLGVSAKDQNLIEKRRLTREEILATYFVPPGIAGLLEHANYASMEVQERLFWQRAVMPITRLLEEALSKNPILSENGKIFFEFDFSEIDVLQKNQKDQADLGSVLISSSQWTPNEVREKIWELPPIIGPGDVLKPLEPQQPQLLGLSLEREVHQKHDKTPEAEHKELPPVHELPKPKMPSTSRLEREEISKAFEDDLNRRDVLVERTIIDHFGKLEDKVLENLRDRLKLGDGKLKKDDINQILVGTEGLTLQFQTDLKADIGEIIRLFADRQVRIIRRLLNRSKFIDRVGKQETTIQSLILSKERFETLEEARTWIEENGFMDDKVDETEDSWRFRQRMPDEFIEGSFRTIELSDGVQAVTGRLKEEEALHKFHYRVVTKQGEDVLFDFRDPNVAAFIQSRGLRAANNIDATTSDAIREALSQGVSDGASIQDMIDIIENFFEGQAKGRALGIARTETSSAANMAIDLVHRQNDDIIEAKGWVTAGDARVRSFDKGDAADHMILDGVEEPLDQDFTPVPGVSAPHPTAFGIAAWDINCRCTTVAVLRGV